MGGDVENDTVVIAKDLPSFCISYSANHITRLVKTGKFPAYFKLSERRNAWYKSEILTFLRERSETMRGQVSEKLRDASRKGAAILAERKANAASRTAGASRRAKARSA